MRLCLRPEKVEEEGEEGQRRGKEKKEGKRRGGGGEEIMCLEYFNGHLGRGIGHPKILAPFSPSLHKDNNTVQMKTISVIVGAFTSFKGQANKQLYQSKSHSKLLRKACQGLPGIC